MRTGLVVACSALALLAAGSAQGRGEVTEPRPAAEYQGEWEGVQWGGGKVWLWKGDMITVKANGSPPNGANFYRVGDVAVRNISPTSVSFTTPGWNTPPRQAFTAECLVREEAADTSTNYVPCRLVLEDSDPDYPPVRKRFDVRIINDRNDLTVHAMGMKLPYGYFDLRKPAK